MAGDGILDSGKICIKRLVKLFFNMMYISAFTFGGGFVIVTLMKKRFVDELGWIGEDEMLDMIAIAQSSPGAIAVNASIAVGWKLSGFLGMVVAVLGTVIPPVALLSAVSLVYDRFITNSYVALVLKGMQAGVAAVIFDVVVGLFDRKSVFSIVLFAVAFVLAYVLKVNVVFVILGAVVIGIARSLLKW